MNKKTILKFNSTKSVRPFAWLALAILAVGAFGNSVHAQEWLNENFNSLGAGVNLAVGGKCVAVGTSGFAKGTTGGALQLTKFNGGPQTDARWTLSDNTYAAANARPSGYISFTIMQTATTSTGELSFRLGANDGNTLGGSTTAWLEARFYNRIFSSGSVNSSAANLRTFVAGTSSSILNSSINNGTSPVKIEIWYNNNASSMSYRHPTTKASTTLNARSFVMYAAGALVSGAAGTETGTALPANVITTGTTTVAGGGTGRIDNVIITASVPEPSSGALLVLGGAALVAIRSLRKKNS
jgi:hypothetical protein